MANELRCLQLGPAPLDERPATYPEYRTIVVLGVPRSGTSVAAGTLHHLGVFMGYGLDDKYEDLALAVPSVRGPLARYLTRSLALEQTSRDVIDLRNLSHAVWGYKCLGSLPQLTQLEKRLRNPYYVVPTRDLLSVAGSVERHLGRDPGQALVTTARQYAKLLRFVSRQERRALIFDFDSALDHPSEFIQRLGDFCGICPTSEQRQSALGFVRRDRGYTAPADFPIEGFLDRVEPRLVSGWASDRHRPDRVVELQVLVDGEPVVTGLADLLRPDVRQRRSHPTGRCGFRITIPDDRAIRRGQEVRVLHAASGKDLVRSGTVYHPDLGARTPPAAALGSRFASARDRLVPMASNWRSRPA